MDPREAGSGLEPKPVDATRAAAPILHDLELGYTSSRGAPPALSAAETADPASTARRKESDASGSVAGARGTDVDDGRKRGAGLTAGDANVQTHPPNKLAIVVPALVLFLSALDQTIVSTALPTIAEQLHATPAEYSWVGTSYSLAMTLLTPLNGRLSDIIGRKPMLYASIIVFGVFSALCGSAKNMTWLIVARAFQGLGGGSIIGLTSMVIADIVPLEKRGTYQGLMGAAWGVASVLGPILGGVLTEKASWRWCFYINLPISGAAFVALFLTLKLNKPRGHTFAEFRKTFDFLGLALIMAGGALVIVGFSIAADDGFDKPAAIALIVLGFVSCLAAIGNFMVTKRNAIIPPTRTTAFFLFASTLHACAFIPVTWLLPQFFQGVRGSSALESGVLLLPYACAVSWITVVAGVVNSRLRIVRPVVWAGYAVGAVGFGLFLRFFHADVALATQLGLQVITGLGCGASLQVPLLVLQAAMPLREMAAITSAWVLTRSLGGAIGIAIYTALLNTELRARFSKIPGDGTVFIVPTSVAGYRALHDLPAGQTRTDVLAAFADSFQVCWIVAMVFFLTCLALTVWTKSYSTKRAVPAPAASEAAPTDEDEETKAGLATE